MVMERGVRRCARACWLRLPVPRVAVGLRRLYVVIWGHWLGWPAAVPLRSCWYLGNKPGECVSTKVVRGNPNKACMVHQGSSPMVHGVQPRPGSDTVTTGEIQ